jgi:hypothetical protein
MLLASRLKQFNASRHQSRLIEAVSSGFMPSGAPKKWKTVRFREFLNVLAAALALMQHLARDRTCESRGPLVIPSPPDQDNSRDKEPASNRLGRGTWTS